MGPTHATPEPPPLPRPPAPDSTAARVAELRDRAADLVDARGPWRLLAVGIVIAASITAVWVLARPGDAGPPLEVLLPTVGPASSLGTAEPAPRDATPPPDRIVVHVAGAVIRPGVVEVAPGARVDDAVAAAGGPAADADLDRINLAGLLSDADHVHVPAIGEPVVSVQPGGAGDDTGPVDLNRADADALDELPGIGPATAAAIIGHRDEHGPFTSVTELQEVPGIGPAKLDRLRGLVTVQS